MVTCYAACDVQMMRGKLGELLVKEFAVFETNREREVCDVVTFGPPCVESDIPVKYQRHNAYVTERVHGLKWEDGTSRYGDSWEILLELTGHYDVLYVKGAEKVKALRSLAGCTVVDAETLGCPNLRSLPTLWASCHNAIHMQDNHFNCAAHNAKRVGLWVLYHLTAKENREKKK